MAATMTRLHQVTVTQAQVSPSKKRQQITILLTRMFLFRKLCII